jgi:hypothetical protein
MKPCQTSFKKQHPREREKRNKEARTKIQASKQPKAGGSQGRKGTTKSRTFHQLHEACPLKRGKVNPIKLSSL